MSKRGPQLHCDFETYSEADLKKIGAHAYASHYSTEINCMGFAFDDEPVQLIEYGQPLPERVVDYVRSGLEVVAHNAPFEFDVWNAVCVFKYGWPPLVIEQMRCTMAQCYAMAIPASLEKAAAALGLSIQKDMVGSRVMMQLAKPDTEGKRHDFEIHREKYERVFAYCRVDVEVERELDKRILPLSTMEKKIWHLDRKINGRGIKIDLKSVDRAIQVVNIEGEQFNEQIRKLTSNFLGSCNENTQFVRWLGTRGIFTDSIDKGHVRDMLERSDLPPDVRLALELRQEAAKSSTAKLVAMKNRVSPDGRVRGTLQYHGAGTGRWAGRGIQVQNFPRPSMKQAHIEEVFGLLESDMPGIDIAPTIRMIYGSPLDVLSQCLRGFMVAGDGCELIGCDFSSIEARVLAWLANAQRILKIFFDKGDPYVHAASGIYAIRPEQVNSVQRQVGKVAELAFGYQGGKGAFQMMAKNYGVKKTDDEAEAIKVNWRNNRPETVQYWRDVESAAMKAVMSPGKIFEVGRPDCLVRYRVNGSFLWCMLPSNRALCYAYPKIEEIDTPWGDKKMGLTYMGEDATTRKWSKQKAYGGLLVENITQAVARDVMAHAMIKLEEHGYEVIFTVHDEVVAEAPAAAANVSEVEKIMCQGPAWAIGLPIAAEGFQGKRYQK